MRDKDGYYFVLGRTDDVINVAGHRLGTREIEEAVQAHPGIAEVAVVGVADPLKGQVPVAFAVVKDPQRVATPEGVAAMRKEVMDTVDRELGRDRAPGRGAFRHAAAEDALGQAAAPLDPGARRRARPGRSHDDRGSGRAGADPDGARRRDRRASAHRAGDARPDGCASGRRSAIMRVLREVRPMPIAPRTGAGRAPLRRMFRSRSPCAATASTRSISARSPWSTATARCSMARAIPAS